MQNRIEAPKSLPRRRHSCPRPSCGRRYCSNPPPVRRYGSPCRRSITCACRPRRAEDLLPPDPLPYGFDTPRQLNLLWTFLVSPGACGHSHHQASPNQNYDSALEGKLVPIAHYRGQPMKTMPSKTETAVPRMAGINFELGKEGRCVTTPVNVG